MKQKYIAVLTAAVLLLQLFSLPASALYEQVTEGLASSAPQGGGEAADPAEPEPVELEPTEPAPEEQEQSEPDPAEQEPEEAPPAEAADGADMPDGAAAGVVAGTVPGIVPMWSAWGPYTAAVFSYGLNVNPGNGNLLDCAIGLALGAELRAELTADCAAIPGVAGEPTIPAWIAYWRTGSVSLSDGAPPDAALLDFAKLGSPGEIRIPDKQFGGWYVFPSAATVPDSTKWFYSVDCTDRVAPDPPEGSTLVIGDDYPSIAGQMSRALPLVARWEDSARAELRAGNTKIVPMRGAVADAPIAALYTEDIGTSGLSGKTPVPFRADVYEYYLRVDSGVTALDMTLAAFEPYYTYFKTQYGTPQATAASPVKATVTYGTETLDLTAGFLGGNAGIMPAPTLVGGTAGVPNNTRENPARSDWRVTVPLEKCAGTGKLYNDLVVTITAPDGTVGTYTFHIQRLAEPSLRLNPGNTPFGMIERDTSALWGSTSALKDAAKAFFRANRTFNFAQNRYPMDTAHNNGGSIMRKSYLPLAWGGGAEDYDCDPTAIVVYQNSAFLDPGISGLTDTLGRAVSAVDGVVRRTIALRTADKLTLDLIRAGGGTTVYYQTAPGGGGELSAGPVTEELRTANGGGAGDVVDLRGKNVLPGIYFIEYSYADTVADKMYDSDPDKFASDKESADTFKRALIVLPIPGDVDMDGMVTPADAAALRELGGMTGATTATTRLNGIAVTSGDPVVDLMFYRVCDVTGEGICNVGTEAATGDVLVLQGGFLPRLARGGESDYYYIPLPDGGAGHPRRELLGGEPAGAGAGQLTLHYLGTQKGEKNSQGFYPAPVAEPIYDGTVPAGDKVQQGDIFWVGVKLTDAAGSGLAGSGISAFTMTLTYDGNYVQPVDVLQEGDISAGGGSVDFWAETIKKYNLGAGARTIWGGTGRYEAPIFGLNKSRDYLTHYTKAITPLEKDVPSGLKELVFSIRLRDGSTPVDLRDGWLLVVPFKLTQFPYDRENPVLVEMGAGMREFLFTGSGPMAEIDAGALPFAAPASRIEGGSGELLAAGEVTAAYSAQDAIYGGTTRNLRDRVKYTEGVGTAIPMGDDNSPSILLTNANVSGAQENARYGEPFRSDFVNGLLDAATPLPPGLRYDGSNTFISGTPTRAGDYTFRIGGIKYQIIVEPAEIRFYVTSQTSYYGQPEFRGSGSADFAAHYYYYTSDIKQVDLDRVGTPVGETTIQNTGRGDALYHLLGGGAGGYTAPGFRAVRNTGQAFETVTAETSVGTYAVICPEENLPKAANYKFRFVDETPSGSSLGVNRLTVTPRPVTVTKLTLDSAGGEYVATIYDNSSEHVNFIPAEYNPATGIRQFAMAPVSTAGSYAGLPLSGDAFIGNDSLSITYTAVFQRTEEDIAVGPIGKRFSVTTAWGWDTREVLIKDVGVVAGPSSGNYQLIQGEENRPTGVQDPPMLGKVQAQIITAIEITSMPANMTYGYGDYLGSGTITFKFIYAGGTEKTGIQLNESSWGAYGVTPRWVTEEEMNTPGEMGGEAYTLDFSERLTVAKHNGRYLCLSVVSWDESTRDEDGNMEPVVIRDFSGRLTVNKRVITLTAQPVERYYGEKNPAAFAFTYDTATLAAFDRKAGDRGDASELLDGRPGMAGYRPPALEAVEALTGDRATVPVTETTPASSNHYFITMAGAEADNYSFVYREGAAGATSETRGYATLTIQRRPIVVLDILSSISEPKSIGQIDGAVVTSWQPMADATGVSLATIYSDTKDLVVSRTKNLNCQYNNNTLRLTPTGAKEFAVGLPTHTASGTQYYPAGGSGSNPLSFPMTFASGASAVVGSDELALTYTATFVPDLAFHMGLSSNYFDMSQADGDTGLRLCDVQVGGMALTGAAAGNYQLVYQRNDDAVNGYPYLREAKLAPQLGRSDSPTVYYYVAGHGVLRTRAITDITIVTTPQMTYTYGEQFAPDMAAAGERYPLTIQVDYDTAYDNTADNITGEQLIYESYGYDDLGELMTNFRDRRMEIRYLPVGETDRSKAKLLELGDYLTVPAHDGKQILVAGRRSEQDTPVYSAPASERLTVHKKNLPIVIQNQSRFYGERNGDYVFTFQKADLAAPDKDWLTVETGVCRAPVTTDGPAAGLPASEGDLKGRGGYIGPGFTTDAQRSSAVRTTDDGSYALTLTGGSMDNYHLVPTGGDGKIFIYPRPIVVTDIDSSISAPDRIGRVDGQVVTSHQPAGSVSGIDLAAVYSDTRELAVTAAATNANCKYNGNILRLSPTLAEFRAELPAYTSAGTEYYPAGGASNPVSTAMTFASGAAALVGGDELALTYTATFVPDLAFHNGIIHNYFDMREADADTGERYCDVQVSNMRLTGASAANYQLVYRRNDNAVSGYPHNRVAKRGPQLGLYDSPTVYYYVSGHGVLHTRAIADVSLVTLPKMTYTYGEQFAPQMPGAGSTAALSVQVNYATTYDNAANNITGERMDYSAALFRDRFMEIRYLPEGETDVTRSVPVEQDEYLTVKDHNGRKLLVTGKRFALDRLTYSPPSAEPLTVYKKNLPLFVQNQYRYYGERNADYTFAFKKSDLAVPDRDWFAGTDGFCRAVSASDGPAAGLPATEGDLKGRGGYAAPQFTTTAERTSDVRDSGNEPYLLTLTGGSMDNYNLVPTGGPGEIFVYRRPIRVTTVVSSEENPVFGVYSDTAERVFDSDKDTDTLPPVLPVAAGERFDNSDHDAAFGGNPNAALGLPLTGNAVLSGDGLTFAIQVTYPDYDSDVLNEGESVFMEVHVTSVALIWGAGAGKNYCLLPEDYRLPATGLVELRRIDSIKLIEPVAKTAYQYPEALDLDGLEVEITYVNLASEDKWVEQVRYTGTAQYAAYGLYLRYTGNGQPPAAGEVDALYQNGRRAESGDHLTVAPTQDTQGGTPFTANGTYLAVIARRHQDQDFANTIIANPDRPIQVAPLPIAFSLAAADKTYDGGTRAVGTLTMHNIFNESAPVDYYHPEGVTDVVFVTTGAENQTPASGYDPSDHRGYETLKHSLREDGYRFTTGVYVRDEANRLADRLDFTGGAYGGVAGDRLTFAFTDHNVAYIEPPGHDAYGPLTTIAVEARHIELAGPDAANYTLVTEITADNCESATGYQDGALPQATIHKAARPALPATLQALGNPGAGLRPTVQIDERTNAVRLEYDMALTPFHVAFDDFKEEDHFEFALQYDASDAGTAQVGRWAGQTGAQAYQDTRFFGGEFVTVDVPSDYRASLPEVPPRYDPEVDVLRGQPYLWYGLDPDVDIYLPAYLRADAEGGGLTDAPYPGYEVYQGTRHALPRDTVLWALVRLAETHNYEASPALSSVPGMDDTLITAETAAAAALTEAQAAYQDEEIPLTQLQQAEQAARTAAEGLLAAVGQTVEETKRAAEAYSARFPAIVEGGRWPEEGLPALEPGPAVKTFRQRIDLLSTTVGRGVGAAASEDMVIPMLETVWFTDIVDYPERRLFDAVVRDFDAPRIYEYFWDADFSAPLTMGDSQNPFTLETAFEVEMNLRRDGQNVREWVTVNRELVDGVPTVGTARVYVNLAWPSDSELRGLRIVPDTVTARLGDHPLQLVVEFNPSDIKRRSIKWDTSDPSVVTVDAYGLIAFTGVGTATITATAYTGKTATATVTVLDRLPTTIEAWDEEMTQAFPQAIFDFTRQLSYAGVDTQTLFHPEREMTRGDLALFMAQFYRENPLWTRVGSGSFPDLTGAEPYAEAARLMGTLGVMVGVEDGSFAGERPVTRAEAVTVLARMLFQEVPDTAGQPHAFLDTGEGDTWAYSYIDALSLFEITRGVGGGYFHPGRIVIRAEAATLVDRLLCKEIDPNQPGILIPADVAEDYWAYLSILRAVNHGQEIAESE